MESGELTSVVRSLSSVGDPRKDEDSRRKIRGLAGDLVAQK